MLRLSAVILLAFGLQGLQAQEVIPDTGGEASGSGGTASYSVGQIVYTTNTGTNGSVAQGVQQPYEISVVTSIEEVNDINLIVSAYPNPTCNFIILKVESYDKTNLSYLLFDIQGKLIETKKIEGNQASIVVRSLEPATYILKVIEGANVVKTLKIVKH